MEMNCTSYVSEGKCSKDKYTRCENYNNGRCLSQHELEIDLRTQVRRYKLIADNVLRDQKQTEGNK